MSTIVICLKAPGHEGLIPPVEPAGLGVASRPLSLLASLRGPAF